MKEDLSGLRDVSGVARREAATAGQSHFETSPGRNGFESVTPFRAIPKLFNVHREGVIMTGNTHSVMKRVVLATALAAGMSGVANAGMGRFEDVYKYFDHPVIDNSPSAWRQYNPQGMSGRELQAMSSEGPAWQMKKPVFANAPAEPSLRQTHPGGLTTRELQAMSSDAPAFQLTHASLVAPNVEADATPSPTKEPFAARLAKLFHAR